MSVLEDAFGEDGLLLEAAWSLSLCVEFFGLVLTLTENMIALWVGVLYVKIKDVIKGKYNCVHSYFVDSENAPGKIRDCCAC